MKVREAAQIPITMSAPWFIWTYPFMAWLAFMDDRPAIGGLLILLAVVPLCDWLVVFANRRIEELDARFDGSRGGDDA